MVDDRNHIAWRHRQLLKLVRSFLLPHHLPPYYYAETSTKWYFESVYQGSSKSPLNTMSTWQNRSQKKHDPNRHYTFDSETNRLQLELCREGSGSKSRECIMVRVYAQISRQMSCNIEFADTNGLETVVWSYAGRTFYLNSRKMNSEIVNYSPWGFSVRFL